MSDESPDMIPRSRLTAKNEQISALTNELKAAKAAAAQFEAASGDAGAWKAKYEATRSELKAATEAHATEITGLKTAAAEQMAMSSAGITDPDIADIARARYAKLPEDSRPDFSDWITGDARKDKVLAILTAEQAAEAEQPTDEPATEAEPVPRASTNSGAAPTPAAAAPSTRAEYHASLDAALRAGDTAKAREIQTAYAGG